MKITDLKKQLNSMEKNELASLVCKLYKASSNSLYLGRFPLTRDVFPKSSIVGAFLLI